MQILTSEHIKQWDQFTIQHEPIASIDLMERAVTQCMKWIEAGKYRQTPFIIYCGKGNNGGDGLALARMLWNRKYIVTVFILEFGHKGTEDFQTNLARLHETGVEILFIQSQDNLHPIPKEAVLIDALFGSGLNRPLDAVTSRLIEHINTSGNKIISIDIPSGMFSNASSKEGPIIKAAHTLSFQCYKLAFLVPENQEYLGDVQILDIGLAPAFLQTLQTQMSLLDSAFIRAIYKTRKSFSHKGSYGHALLVAGSYGKMGAAVLSAKACLRAGVGLLTCYMPACGYTIVQASVPEAMALTDPNDRFITADDIDVEKYTVIGIGPGLGTESKTSDSLKHLLSVLKSPAVLDADALNMIAADKEFLKKLYPFSILTPHPKEFERLFGPSKNDFEKLELAKSKAEELQVIIVLKGHNTFIAMPGGRAYFNSTGNAGMATGGSGDVLTGILTSLLAQNYEPEQAALLGVYLHGMAGDFAAVKKSEEALIALDIVDCLGDAFLEIKNG